MSEFDYAHRLCALAFLLAVFLVVVPGAAASDEVVNLAGKWRFALDPHDQGMRESWWKQPLSDSLTLPGTTDLAGKGYPLRKDSMDYAVSIPESDWPSKPAPARADDAGHLVREWAYVGKAWYQRTFKVPHAWRGKFLRLCLERVLWRSDVWLDDRAVGAADSLASPHWLDLGVLEPGTHRLTLRVDNALQCNIGIATHAFGPETQSQWNGVVGALRVVAEEPVFVECVKVFPSDDRRGARVDAVVRNTTGRPWKGRVAVGIQEDWSHTPRGENVIEAECSGERQPISVTVSLDDQARPWDEFSTNRYRAIVTVGASSEASAIAVFGFRRIVVDGRHILVNGRRVFLRGTLDCCVYPKTGHPPMTVEEWLRILGTVKGFGFNHVRFHTWCPPDAAFEAADRLGLYLMPEAALWVDSWTMGCATKPKAPGRDPAVNEFIQAEIRRISDTYGNHPSFALFGIGNEFADKESDWDLIDRWVADAKAYDPRRLYAASTARRAVSSDDFRVTHEAGGKPARGVLAQGTDWDYAQAAEASSLPVIAHEIGQHPTFPDYNALLPEFTGPLKPYDLDRFRASLLDSGLSGQARAFVRASALFQAEQYKAEHEAMLRTADCAGFHLLMLNDFSGQSEALVGMLDAFGESKGVITRSEVVAWNGATVPLARFAKCTWSNSEDFRARIEVAHYGEGDLVGCPAGWCLKTQAGRVIAKGEFSVSPIPAGRLTSLGEIKVPLGQVDRACEITLSVRVGQARNAWKLWVYPETGLEAAGDVLVSKSVDETLAGAAQGRRVLLLAHGAKGKRCDRTPFASVYWSAGWWGNRFSHLGILCDSRHSALREFPNDGHSDWQWQELADGATTFCFEGAPGDFMPIVQLVPDFHFNTLLGQVFEARVGEGRLIVCGYDLDSNLGNRPAARQFRNGLLRYMKGEAFRPPSSLSPEYLRSLFE